MPDSSNPPERSGGGDVNLEATTRLCPDCGSAFTGESHKNCVSHGSTVKRGASTSKSRLDEMPPEALEFDQDPGRQLNQYILVKQIGKGGMGTVWKAWDRKLTRWVAIKFLLASEEEDIVRFQREAKLAARLRHPNIAPIYEVGDCPATQAGQQTRHYLAMEFIDGQSMANVELSLREALDIFCKVSQGVEAAHRGGVVHRDLKPQNIMLTSDRWPYVMDFGLAKALQTESSISVSGAVMGTPAYMPPEQARGELEEIDPQSDVYSLGATIYAVLTQKQPFHGRNAMDILMKVCNEGPVAPRSHNADIPPEVEAIILKAMSRNKADRYLTAGALGEDLKRYLQNQEIVASTVRVAAKKKGSLAPLWLLLVVLLLGGGGAYWFLKIRPAPGPVAPEGAGPVKPPDDAEARAAAWTEAWTEFRRRLDYDDWQPADARMVDEARKLLGRMKEEANKYTVSAVADWGDNQAARARDAAASLGPRDQGRAKRVAGWCQAFEAAVKGVEELAPAAEVARKSRLQALPVADFKGNFVLKLAVGPYAEITRVTRNGQPVAVAARSTPALLSGLEIGDYEIVLKHPQHGTRQVKLETARLKEGKTYQVSGRMQDPALKVTELP